MQNWMYRNGEVCKFGHKNPYPFKNYIIPCIRIEGNIGELPHKLSSAKIPCLILNNIKNVQILQSWCHQMCFVVNLPKFTPTKFPSVQ